MREHLCILKERLFRRFFLASFISCFGSGLHLIAAAWFVFEKTGSSAAVAAIWIFQVASCPIVLISSGALIDRISRPKILWVLSIVRGAVVLSVPALIWLEAFSMWQLYLMAMLNGIGFMVSSSAEKAWVREMAEQRTLMSANAMGEASIQAGIFLSAGLSGLIYERAGFSGVLAIDAATFLLAAAIFSRLPKSVARALAARGQPYLEAVRDGWRYLLEHRVVLVFAVIAFLPAAVTTASNVVMPVYVREVIGQGVVSYGALDMAYGIGAFLSGFGVLWFMKIGRTKAVVGLILVCAAALAAFPSIGIIWAALAMDVVYGLCNSSLRIILSTILMEMAPSDFMGRISSAALLSSTAFQLVSFAAVGYAADRVSVGAGYGYLCAFMFVALIGFVLVRKRMHWDEENNGAGLFPQTA